MSRLEIAIEVMKNARLDFSIIVLRATYCLAQQPLSKFGDNNDNNDNNINFDDDIIDSGSKKDKKGIIFILIILYSFYQVKRYCNEDY